MNEQEIIEGIMRVDNYNDQFRQSNPNGRYPVCKPALYKMICERCGYPINRQVTYPCPAVSREDRWGEDYTLEDVNKVIRLINEGEI